MQKIQTEEIGNKLNLANLFDSNYLKSISVSEAANFSIFVLIMRSLSSALADFENDDFKQFVRSSNFHMILVIGLTTLQMRGYKDISSGDLFDYISHTFSRTSHSNFRRILNEAVTKNIFLKMYSSYDKRVKSFLLSDYAIGSFLALFSDSLSVLQNEFDQSLVANESIDFYLVLKKIMNVSREIHESFSDSSSNSRG